MCHQRYSQRKNLILTIIRNKCAGLSLEPGKEGRSDRAAQWISTRDIADLSNESIYSTRNMLLALEDDGKVKSSKKPQEKALRWQISCAFAPNSETKELPCPSLMRCQEDTVRCSRNSPR